MIASVLLIGGLLPTAADASLRAAAADARPAGAGVWVWPLSPRPSVEHFFDAPDGPYSSGHRGVDLLGRPGQEVRAVDDGTVAYAGRVGGIGVVSLDTAAGRVTYQPVSASVRRGDVVRAGTVLGHLLTSSGHCVPRACLHLGLIVAGEYQDPLRFLGGGPVRLLPLGDALSSPAPVSPSAAAIRPSGFGVPVGFTGRPLLSTAVSAGSRAAASIGVGVATPPGESTVVARLGRALGWLTQDPQARGWASR